MVPSWHLARRDPLTAPLSDLLCVYATGETIRSARLPPGTDRVVVRTAFGRAIAGELRGDEARIDAVPTGTHVIELYSESGQLLADELVGVRAERGDDPVVAFATSFNAATVPATLHWLRRLRCTVVQIYDWMESYSQPLGPPGHYRDRLGRAIDRAALETLIAGIRELGAVPQAYAPVCAADPGFRPEWLLRRNDGGPEALGDLLQIMDPANPDWQRHWLEQYGRAADALGFAGFHLDTYGYPRVAVGGDGNPAAIDDGYASFVRTVRAARPADVISFNQVNGVPRGFAAPARPGFRYAEVWPPNDRWRHLEGLIARSAGGAPRQGDTLAIYPPVWGADRAAALRTVVLTEAVGTALGIGTLMWGDAVGVLRHPYYVDHERLSESEADVAVAWHRFALRCRDLFNGGTDTSWYELDDENAAVTVSAAVPVRPEPDGGALFARVVRHADTVVVSLIDLSGSAGGSWSGPTERGRCTEAVVSALLDQPGRWRADVAVLGRAGGRFEPVELEPARHREGQAVTAAVPLIDGWSVVRFQRTVS